MDTNPQTDVEQRHSLDYMPSMSSMATSADNSECHSIPSIASTGLDSILSLSSTPSSPPRLGHRIRSISLLGKIPASFSSLLRSHTPASRRNSLVFESAQSAKVSLTDYADTSRTYDSTTLKASDMYTHKDEERASRKHKQENRFYRFLTSSRSRSRSKSDQATDDGAHCDENLSHSRQSSVSKRAHRDSAKHSTHTDSTVRPMSSATNTTARIHQPKPVHPLPSASPQAHSSRPSTPSKPISSTRKKLHNIFGIPLTGPRRTGSRKSSMSSTRANTPEPREPPPMPEASGSYSSNNDPISAPRKPKPPSISIQRSESQSSRSRWKNSTFDSTESSVSTTASSLSKRDSLSKSQKPFVSRPVPSSPTLPTSHLTEDSRHSTAPRHRRAHLVPETLSRSLPSSPAAAFQTFHLAPDSKRAPDPVSRGAYTAAAPQRPGSTPPRLHHRKNSLDMHREMSVVDEERSILDSEAEMGVGKRSDVSSRLGQQSTRSKINQMTARSTRHGSFDFERPSWGFMSRSASNASSSAGASDAWQSGDKLPRTRMSPKASTKDMPTDRRNGLRTPPPQHSSQSASLSHGKTTSGTSNGATSSWGRSSGRRGKASGVAKLVTIEHGTFAFEPPVPSPVSFTHADMSDIEDPSERRRRRRREEDGIEERWRDLNSSHSAVTSLGFRSGEKGRSLDLNLGLSWVPSKVRQDALLPSSMFPLDKRSQSHSGSSRSGGRIENGQNGRDGSSIGKDIAEKFRLALDPTGYSAFKRYVHQFDAQEIPFDGPTGIVARVERLLENSSNLTDDRKRRLVDNLVRIILHNT
ncbi:hypothetical protein CYLTODRAFT_420436 [Cylindrobasidium torrendii FP15055 ss-10]|uniref:Uncharacterized protein n=1 Tax=Cylindrobasidium torrendii FP15055 ss-10 TaxID=1314674 RepID=A0A0D7BJF6_9AGAR|nr:hypothetical protein CYLTODRAFT_420436 [Cylindrobasidium torrendii FP15055 ss-10]